MDKSPDPAIHEPDHELIMTLRDANALPSQIKRVLNEKRYKKVSLKKVQHLIDKLSHDSPDGNVQDLAKVF